MSTFIAFFAFIFAAYLGMLALSRAGDWDGAREAKWSGIGALAFLLIALVALCYGVTR